MGKFKLVYICSPYRADNEDELNYNIWLAQKACRHATLNDCIPIAPHIYFTQFLNDDSEDERELGIKCGMGLLDECDELWIVGNKISEGMQAEIDYAKRHGIMVIALPVI